MKRIVIAMMVASSTASAAPCDSLDACAETCDGGDPVACVLAATTTFSPLPTTKIEPTNNVCAGATFTCVRHAARLWSGAGTQPDRATATKLWKELCGEEPTACLAYAKAIEAKRPDEARELYREACGTRDNERACRAAAHMWTRTSAKLHRTKISIEVPSVMKTIKVWGPGSWHVLWNVSTQKPDLKVEIVDGKPVCSTSEPDARHPKHVAKYTRRMPADWQKRACDSVRVVK